MTADPLADWWCHQAGVRRLAGEGAYGPVYSPAEPTDPDQFACFIDQGTRLIVGADGQQAVASGAVFFPLTVPAISVGSQVILPDAFGGRTCRVIEYKRHDAGTQPVPSHQEVAVQ